MSSSIIKVMGVSHRYAKGVAALDHINVSVRRGDIYGFLGPNGSGKTTALSVMLGLLPTQKGRILLFDEELQNNRTQILRRVGSLIEAPSLYGHLTAKENVEVFRVLYRMPPARTGEVLAMAGLADTGSKSVRRFSLGMKQRLAIAIALLPKPEVLVLDEPTNGLDPAGIIEFRELVKTLSQEHGVTILVSSHILSEVEKMATHVGIILRGRIIFEGSMRELHQRTRSKLIVRTSDNQKAAQLLDHCAFDQAGGTIAVPFVDEFHSGLIVRTLVENQIDVFQLHPVANDLEQTFLELTSNAD